ncbi:hypothetical protein HMPREF1982_03151 [Clostridiales bacterium oral taxon 876 str. F0540]|nr:hypothetical protein HMPREF1982_03151 [Clostridiales bacterium oral taxon 876 str. F0540]
MNFSPFLFAKFLTISYNNIIWFFSKLKGGKIIMDNNKSKKLGGGILTVSIIQLVIYAIGLIGLVPLVFARDKVEAQLATMKINTPMPTQNQNITSLILSVVIIIGIILILLKKAVGVYAYFIAMALEIIFSIMDNGFKSSMIISFLFPILMGIFIYQKKEIFGFGSKNKSENISE